MLLQVALLLDVTMRIHCLDYLTQLNISRVAQGEKAWERAAGLIMNDHELYL